MANEPTPLAGPDLSQGVSLAELAEGAPFIGHAGGEPVILVRRGKEIFAVGATCTHYSGPLAEGLVVGDTVRCPWHHACYSLRTGAPAAPALNAIPCWNVEQRDGRVVVKDKREAPAPAPRAAKDPKNIVIVGAGAAGNAAAETLRREGYAGSITLIGADPSGPYDRPNLSKDYLAGTAPEEWIPLRSPEFYREQKIDLRTGTTVKAVEVKERRVRLEDGSTFPWDRLLLATGADPVHLSIPGAEGPNVYYLRTLADSRRLIAATEEGKRAIVIGSSFIGLEVAAALRAREIEVHVVAPESRPLERILGPDLGEFIRGVHQARGVQFHLGHTPRSIGKEGVTLDDGRVLAADFVVIGVGVRPALALAESAGLALDRGVLVNERLETSVPGIFAAGDIARWPDRSTGERIRVEHWAVAERQGQAAARSMLDIAQPFRDVPFFWSQHYDVSISYVGHAEKWERLEIRGDLANRDAACVFRSASRVLAVASIFRDRLSLEVEAAMERGDDLALEQLVRG